MIKSIEFKNFKVLRDCTLPLGPFTLLVGPNGSGKSTAIQAFKFLNDPASLGSEGVVTASLRQSETRRVEIIFWAGPPYEGVGITTLGVQGQSVVHGLSGAPVPSKARRDLERDLQGARAYAFRADAIIAPVTLEKKMQLGPNGGSLAGVLDRLRDDHPERFEALNDELGRWIPEFDRVLFDMPGSGTRAFAMRTRKGGHKIQACDVSQGTVLALAILTLAYMPDPPSIVCLEEPDRGIHPRLLRDVRDAIYRLSYPQDFGEDREPVQVIATTHSPYMLDLFKDHLDEIVVCEKLEDNVRFTRLSELPHVEEILEESRLGDAWYTGILGGVPADR